jgi:hypothetical protein
MEGVAAAAGAHLDYGPGAVLGEVFWEEVCLLG